jgi:hypothetical protein
VPLYAWIIIFVVFAAVSLVLKTIQKNKDSDALARRKAQLDADKRRNQGL